MALRQTRSVTTVIELPATEDCEAAILTLICEGDAPPRMVRLTSGTGDARAEVTLGAELLERIGTLLEDRRRDLPGEYSRRCCPEHGILEWPQGAYRCPACQRAEGAGDPPVAS